MSKHIPPGCALWSFESAPGELFVRRAHLSSGWLPTLVSWIDRSHQRRALGELAELNNYLLEDIGVSKEQALHESTKPFWQ